MRETGEKQANIRDVFDSSDSEEEEKVLTTPTGTPAPNPKEVTLSEESTPRGDEIKETNTHPSSQVGGSHVVRNDHYLGHPNRTHYENIGVQIGTQVTHVSKGGLTSLSNGCPFCDILIHVPLKLEKINWTVVIVIPKNHHFLAFGRKRNRSESEEGESEDPME